MIRKKLGLICGASAFLILILDSRAAAQAAAEGVQVCLRTVIPCLFPFFLLSGYLTGNLEGGKSIATLFHCPENCGSVLLTGLLGGYPVGAKQAAEAWRVGIITKAQADRLLRFCSQAGPSFLFGIVSARVGGVREGWILWGIQVLSALSVAWLLPMEPDHYTPRNRAERKNNNLMTSALSAMASVCGWVILFSVVISFARRWFLWLLPDSLQILLCGLLELTSGCLLLMDVPNRAMRLLMGAVMLNFGGICVLMQTFSLTDGNGIRGYLSGKLLQTAFAVLYALVWMGHLRALIPIVFVFFIQKLCYFKNSGRFPVKIGV